MNKYICPKCGSENGSQSTDPTSQEKCTNCGEVFTMQVKKKGRIVDLKATSIAKLMEKPEWCDWE
jgi:transcription elongation factor Elf1